MFTADFRRRVAAIFCTLVMSSACIVSAVGPAQAGGSVPAPTQTVA